MGLGWTSTEKMRKTRLRAKFVDEKRTSSFSLRRLRCRCFCCYCHCRCRRRHFSSAGTKGRAWAERRPTINTVGPGTDWRGSCELLVAFEVSRTLWRDSGVAAIWPTDSVRPIIDTTRRVTAGNVRSSSSARSHRLQYIFTGREQN